MADGRLRDVEPIGSARDAFRAGDFHDQAEVTRIEKFCHEEYSILILKLMRLAHINICDSTHPLYSGLDTDERLSHGRRPSQRGRPDASQSCGIDGADAPCGIGADAGCPRGWRAGDVGARGLVRGAHGSNGGEEIAASADARCARSAPLSAFLGGPRRSRGRADWRRAAGMRDGALRSLPAAHRSAARHVPRTRIDRAACRWRCAGSAIRAGIPCLRAFPAAAASSTRCISGFTRRHARRAPRRDHRRVAVGVPARAGERMVRRVDRVRPDLQRRAVRRVRGPRRSRVPAEACPAQTAAARSHVPRHRAHHLRHAVVPDLRARSAGGFDLLPERDG